MNFDELRDPSPPRADAATLAAVAGRGRTLRRRRVALTTLGGALAVALVAVPVGLALREGSVDRLVPATQPSVGSDPSVPSTPSSPPSPSSPVATSVRPVSEPLLTAVTAGGEAVVVAADGTTTVLEVAAATLPPGVEARTLLMTPSRRVFIGVCCLSAGSSDGDPFRWGEPAAGALDRPGQLRAIDADGSALAVVRGDGVALTDLEGSPTASARPDGESTVVDVAFLPDGRIAVVDLYTDEAAGFVGRLHVTDDDLSTLPTSSGTVLGPVEGNGTWRLAGTDASGDVLVVAGGDGLFQGRPRAFDPATLVETAPPSTTTGDAVVDVWFDAGVATWIDTDGRLWHDAAMIADGPYVWSRPITD